MTGLQGEMRDRILGSTAHIYVWRSGGIPDYQADVRKLRQVPGVVGAGPAVLGKAMISAGDVQEFITFKGVDPALEPNVTDVQKSMIEGSVQALANESATGSPGILIGTSLAAKLGVKVNDSVTLTTPQSTLTPMGMIPRVRRVTVAGIYSLGLFEFDSEYGFISLDLAKRLMSTDQPQLIELRVGDIYQAPQIADQIPKQLGADYSAEDWADLNQSLFGALWLEKMAISITIGLIVMVAALNIVASLILLVMEKSRDVAILKTMGLAPGRVMRIFMLQGLIIGVIGTAVGAIGGLTLCYVLDKYKLIQIPMDVYQVSYVPFVVTLWPDLILVLVSAVAICFIATLYPSRQASRLDPVQALRFE
jgi:lipoprotein-releasing system permease protein